jgi:WD40-like Beta Propeller Repeat
MRALVLLGSLLFFVGLLEAPGLSSSVGAPAAQVEPGESVRAELVRRNKETGLTLAFYENYLQVVTFDKRGKYEGKPLIPHQLSTGAVSPDGTEIAIDINNLLEHRLPSLGIIRPDGSDFREYTEVSPAQVCWSHDQSRLAMSSYDMAPKVSLVIFDMSSKLTQMVLPRVVDPHISAQCWSPDDKQIVYEFEGNVRVQEIGKDRSTVLAKGTEPTWSPGGSWIAFRDRDTYSAIHPNGDGRKKLFHKKNAVSGLFWSPDSRLVAYVSQADFFEQFPIIDAEVYMLRIRRLEDNSEVTVAGGVGAGVGYQWVTNRELPSVVQAQAPRR